MRRRRRRRRRRNPNNVQPWTFALTIKSRNISVYLRRHESKPAAYFILITGGQKMNLKTHKRERLDPSAFKSANE
jgi:hypothetical protein